MALSMYDERHRDFSLAEPIVKLLPDFRMNLPAPSEDMTLTDVLTQQTGLPRNEALWYLGPFTRPQIYYRLPFVPQLRDGFRQGFFYSNVMYAMAGQILEAHSGRNWEDHIKEKILDPLGMKDTTASFTDFINHPNHALGYDKDIRVPLKDFTNIAPAASLNSNVLDMAKWLRLLLTGGFGPNGNRLIAEARVRTMISPLIDMQMPQFPGLFYGMGWMVHEVLRHPYIFHWGIPDGQTAYVSFMPDLGLGVVALTNQHSTPKLGGVWPDMIANNIYDFLIHDEIIPGRVQIAPGPVNRLSNDEPMAHDEPMPVTAAHAKLTLEELNEYGGMYTDGGYGDMAISRKGRGLRISYFGQHWDLVRIKDDAFVFVVPAFATRWKLPAVFQRTRGKVTGVVIPLRKPPDTPVIFIKRPRAV
jgi:CubicO group peptidase (beta-lactamase class C family)